MNPIHSINKKWLILLTFIPIIIILGGYEYFSYLRHLDNPSDKIFPSISSVWDAFYHYGFEEDKRSGKILLWADTFESMKIYIISILASISIAALFGVMLGLYSVVRGLFLSLIVFLSIVPPLAILPILLISFGVGIESKIALIFIGTFPIATLLIYQSVKQINRNEIIKAKTLGFGNFELSYKIILPRSIPSIIEALRVSNGMVWLLLIASESISAQVGLGYRIFLVRRYMAMDVIFAYIFWIVLIAFIIDHGLKLIIQWRYPWYYNK